MKWVRGNILYGIINAYIIDSPTSANISYVWNIGSLLGVVLIMQVITGIWLSFYYTGNIMDAFNSIEHITRDILYGAILRYIHSNGAALYFILVYMHIGKAIYYGSYNGMRIGLWNVGILIFIIMMATAFIGYTLPFGSMSYWGATVITSLFSALPYVGDEIVVLLWGGFSINSGTISRFYALHFVLPFIMLAMVIIHIIYLHRTGSNNPLGITSNTDIIPFHPYYIYKDIIGFILLYLIYTILILYYPDIFGHSDNYIAADPLVTPPTIVPEFYFQAYYAILRAIPNKLLGVLTMLYGILILYQLPYNYNYNCNYAINKYNAYNAYKSNKYININIKCNSFRPIGKINYWLFNANFILLTWLGGELATELNVILSQITTCLYFSYLLFLIFIYLYYICSYYYNINYYINYYFTYALIT